MVFLVIIMILLMTQNQYTYASGYEAYTSCYRTSRKRPDVPCDFGAQTWCNIPGSSYPWHAVRRFVHENQGLMRRMYGDERHISVLRAELDTNDIETHVHNAKIQEEFRRRYSKDMDGSSDFVKMFINNESRNVPKQTPQAKIKVEKLQKSIDEKSSNVLFQTHFKNGDESNGFKTAYVSSFSTANKSTAATSTSATVVPNTTRLPVTETTTVLQKETVKSNETINATTTMIETTSSISETMPTTMLDATTEQIPSQLDGSDATYNFTNTTTLPNDTLIEEDGDYAAETEEMMTTTGSEALTTTDEVDFEDDEVQDEEGYEDMEVEGVEPDMEEQEAVVEPVTQKAPPTIKLKGINACPVKEEVVAPFWANNTRGEVLALLNLYPFEQYVHWEKCTYEHKQMFCREGCRCEQQYRLHRLLAYDPNNECRGIFSDWFRFPSCCVCKCYDLPMEFRLTSRSPRFQTSNIRQRHPLGRLNPVVKP